MNRLKLLATATLMALTFTACDEGTPPPVEPPPPPTPVGTISGTVTIEGTAASGITATLSSGATTTTGSGGNFAFSGVEAGTYTVTISGFPEDATFAQVTQSATIATDGQNVQLNFAGEYIRSSAVVGNVVAADAMMSGGDGQPETLAGVTVTLDGEHAMGETMETGMDGGFAFTGLRAGTYTVTISDFPEDISFETVSVEVEVEVGEVGQADFTGHYIRTSAVEGQVIIEGEGLAGVTVTLAGGPADENFTMMTDADGMYRFEDLRPGDYTVSISDFDTRDYEFAATSQDVSVDLDETGTVSFTGVLLRTSGISGRVSVEGMGLDNIAVTLSGAADASTMTDAGGQYSFAGLAAGDYTVSIAVESAAYVFDSMSQDRTVGDDESAIVNFEGQHARTASVSGMAFLDELDKNNEHDAGEHPLAQANIPVALVGPGVNDQRLSATDAEGQFSFTGLRAGTYQLIVDIGGTAAAALMAADVEYGGLDIGYTISVGVGEAKTQNIPFDITHTTVNFSVSLRSGDKMGDPLPGAMVTLSSGESGMTRDDGSVPIRVAREGVEGNTVQASVSHDDYAADDDMTPVTWDPQMFAVDAENANDIVNLDVNVNISGATVARGDYGGEPLAGWAISVMGDAAAVANAPTALGDDGSVPFTPTVESVPASFTFAVADDQDDELDGGESYSGDDATYTHNGLSLAGDPVDADAIVVTYTTQTLKVYVHHERDQVYGYTGSSLDGDSRIGGVVDIQIRHVGANGRPSLFTTAQWDSEDNTTIGRGSRAGTYTYTNLPAGADVFVTADAMDGYMLLDPRRLNAYGDAEGLTGGAFGDMGGWGHTVSLCPLKAVDPTGQDHGECGSFAVVKTYEVSADVSKMRVRTSGVGFNSSDPSETTQKEIKVELTPVEGKNLGGNARSRTTAESDHPGTTYNDKRELRFGTMAAGTYALGLPAGWRATDQTGARGQTALAPLGGDVKLTVTPSTAVLYGFVRNASQVGLEGVTVHVNGTTVETDQWGRYITPGFAAMRGQVIVHTSRTGFPDSAPDSTNNPNAGTHPPAFAPNSVNLHNITLGGANQTFTVTGTVVDASTGLPLGGVRIQGRNSLAGTSFDPLNGRPSGSKKGQVLTESDGTYEAIFAAKRVGEFVWVQPSKSGYEFLDAPRQLHAQQGLTHRNIDFRGYTRGKVVGRVLAPGGGTMAGIKVSAYTSPRGTKPVSETVTTSTGTFSLAVGAFGSFEIDAKVVCAKNPVTDAEIDACRQEAFSWFDYPRNSQMGTVIDAGQPVQFGDIQMRSVQPRIKSANRLTHAAIDLDATPVVVPGDYREFVEVTWEYDRQASKADHLVAGTGGIALPAADLKADPATPTGDPISLTDFAIGHFSTTGSFVAGLAPDDAEDTKQATDAITGSTSQTVTTKSVIRIPTDNDGHGYRKFSGRIQLTTSTTTAITAFRSYANPWLETPEKPSASFTVDAAATTASGVVASRDPDDDDATLDFRFRWTGKGSPRLVRRVAMLVEGRWVYIPNAGTLTRVTDTGGSRGQWQLDVTPTITADTGWDMVGGGTSPEVTAGHLKKALQVKIYTGHGADVTTAVGWAASPAVSLGAGS